MKYYNKLLQCFWCKHAQACPKQVEKGYHLSTQRLPLTMFREVNVWFTCWSCAKLNQCICVYVCMCTSFEFCENEWKECPSSAQDHRFCCWGDSFFRWGACHFYCSSSIGNPSITHCRLQLAWHIPGISQSCTREDRCITYISGVNPLYQATVYYTVVTLWIDNHGITLKCEASQKW